MDQYRRSTSVFAARAATELRRAHPRLQLGQQFRVPDRSGLDLLRRHQSTIPGEQRVGKAVRGVREGRAHTDAEHARHRLHAIVDQLVHGGRWHDETLTSQQPLDGRRELGEPGRTAGQWHTASSADRARPMSGGGAQSSPN